MASIRAIAANVTAIRPNQAHPALKTGPRVNVPVEFAPGAKAAGVAAGRKADVPAELAPPQADPRLTPDSVRIAGTGAAGSAQQAEFGDPVDLSGVTDRTRAVIDHTVKALMANAGLSDDAIVDSVGAMFKGLVASDGVTSPEAAARALVLESIAAIRSAGLGGQEPDPMVVTDMAATKAGGGVSGALDIAG